MLLDRWNIIVGDENDRKPEELQIEILTIAGQPAQITECFRQKRRTENVLKFMDEVPWYHTALLSPLPPSISSSHNKHINHEFIRIISH